MQSPLPGGFGPHEGAGFPQGDGMQPGGEAVSYPKSRGVTGEPAKGVLGGFLGHFTGTGAAAGGAEDESEMPLCQGREGGSVSGFDKGCQQFPVGWCGGRSHPEEQDTTRREPDSFFGTVGFSFILFGKMTGHGWHGFNG
jgi:hypothetical protein